MAPLVLVGKTVVKRIRFVITESLLWIVAALGLVTIVLVICAYVFNVSIILFRTGSMEPTIPAGSAALVREIPADEVRVGDALTVEREGQLPVTHRVTSVEPGSHSGERVITMQGDANDTPDPYPYTITEGRVVMGSLPGIAPVINQMGTPYAMGGITLAAALLVGWAFWPRGEVPPPHRNGSRRKGDRPTIANHDAASDLHPQAQDVTTHRARHAAMGVLAVSAVTGVLLVNSAPSAHATSENVVTEVHSSQYITLTSVYIPTTRTEMDFGDISTWDVGVDFMTPSVGNARLGLSVVGELPLNVDIHICSQPWSDIPAAQLTNPASCPGEYELIGENYRATDDTEIQWIEDFTTATEPWLRLNVTLTESGYVPSAGVSALRVHVGVHEDELSVSPGDPSSPVAPDAVDSDPGASAPPTVGAPGSPIQGEGPAASPLSPHTEQDALARTGASVLLLIVVALSSMLLGRWLTGRSRHKSQPAVSNMDVTS